MIAIIGRGNVALHLYKALKGKTDVALVNPHTMEGFPENTDITLISVSDNAIEEVSKKIPPSDAVIAHTAGSVPMEILSGQNKDYGVFYPLQTFTKDVDLNYKEIPVFIEGSSTEVTEKLKKTASLFSEDVREADSETRKKLHLASVFANNFTNALAGVSQDILKDTDITFSALIPLMKQTVNKLGFLSPREAQTGPAARGDSKVINSHLEMLRDKPELQEIYSKMSNLISQKNEKRL